MYGNVCKLIMEVKCMAHILIVDDEINIRKVVREYAEFEGYEVTEAENGRIAVEKFTNSPENSFDVILMDIMMPEMNGYEATKAIRSSNHPDAKKIPIIAMTANAFAEDKIKAIESGMNAHTSKPINFPVLVSEITKILNRDEDF